METPEQVRHLRRIAALLELMELAEAPVLGVSYSLNRPTTASYRFCVQLAASFNSSSTQPCFGWGPTIEAAYVEAYAEFDKRRRKHADYQLSLQAEAIRQRYLDLAEAEIAALKTRPTTPQP